VPIELAMPNRRPTAGVITRNSIIPDGEVTNRGPVKLTTVDRTAFDLARCDLIRQAVARRHPRARGIRRVDEVLDLVDAGAESPQETRVRLLLMDNGFPRPRTQIPVVGPDGYPRYYLGMGWDDIMVAVEYDGEHHRKNTADYRKDIIRLEYIQSLGWIVVRVVAGNRPRGVVERVRQARELKLR
jgi:very-short-patch-repair endonuclease